MTDPAPTLALQVTADARQATLSGCWSAARLAEPANWMRITQAVAACTDAKAGPCHWDLCALQRLDHTGAQLLWNAWGHQWPVQLALLPGQRVMLERVARYTTVTPTPPRTHWMAVFLKLGEAIWS